MFNNLVKEHPETADMDQDNLKRHVRDSLNQLKTGTSNEGNEKAALQDDEVKKRLKMTNGYAAKVMLAKRESIANGKVSNDDTAGPATSPDSEERDATNQPKPTSRLGLRQAHTKSVQELSENFKTTSAAFTSHL